LLTGVHFNLDRVFIRPRDVEPARNSHETGGPVRLTLLSGGDVFIGIPIVGSAAASAVQRNAGIISLGRRDHAKSPVFRDESNPVTGKILGCVGLGSEGWGRWSAASRLAEHAGWKREHERRQSRQLQIHEHVTGHVTEQRRSIRIHRTGA
jgi:hypothetical protein